MNKKWALILLAVCLVVLLSGCGGGVGKLKSPKGTVTIESVDITDRVPVGCKIGEAMCTKLRSPNVMVWYTVDSDISAADLMSAYLMDKDNEKFTASGNGLMSGKMFIAFPVKEGSSGFKLYWLENPPLSLGK